MGGVFCCSAKKRHQEALIDAVEDEEDESEKESDIAENSIVNRYISQTSHISIPQDIRRLCWRYFYEDPNDKAYLYAFTAVDLSVYLQHVIPFDGRLQVVWAMLAEEEELPERKLFWALFIIADFYLKWRFGTQNAVDREQGRLTQKCKPISNWIQQHKMSDKESLNEEEFAQLLPVWLRDWHIANSRQDQASN